MTLPEGLTYLPDRKRRELQRAVRILFDEFEEAQKTKLSEKARRGRILKLILFGSYARNDWVEDRKSGYLSDFDILVIVNYENFAEQFEAWEREADRFARELGITGHIKTPVNFIVHSYEDVNSQLSQGRPFFVDIARDGIVLYETAGYDLAAPRQLSPEEARAEGRKHFEHWFPDAVELLAGASFYRNRGNSKLAAFQLHQTAERLYHCVLQVLALYSPKSHRLTFLCSQAKRSFSRLDRAYVGARYSPAYEISDEELTWLTERITRLQDVVEQICRAHLEKTED